MIILLYVPNKIPFHMHVKLHLTEEIVTIHAYYIFYMNTLKLDIKSEKLIYFIVYNSQLMAVGRL